MLLYIDGVINADQIIDAAQFELLGNDFGSLHKD